MELKIEARNLDLRQGWKEKIDEERNKLIRHYANFVLHLRVTIESTPGYKEGGYEVRLIASVPNDTVVVKRWGEKVHPLLVEAFDVLGLRLKEIVRKKQNHKSVKLTGSVPDARVSGTLRKLYLDQDYGFITAPDDQDIFFHANVLRNAGMNDLNEGDGVFFAIEDGDKGLQASWVKPERS